MAETAEIAGLHIYPVKSCAGLTLSECEVGPRGPLWDRNWMIVDENARFLTQRQLPQMALIKTKLYDDSLLLSIEGHGDIAVPLHAHRLLECEVDVWSDRCDALDEGKQVSEFLSTFLGKHCSLVRMASDFLRNVGSKYGNENAQTGFADSLPFLLTSEESLQELNGRLPEPVPMDRFRPNLVIRGASPYAEDSWSEIKIGEIEFEMPRACTRCSITTVDQVTGQAGKEPLKTLATYRRKEKGIVFGQTIIHRQLGRLKIGDKVHVLKMNS